MITPPFRRTLRVNSHPAHRACEAWWWAAATTADRGLCTCVRVRSAPVGRVMGVASTVHCTNLVLRTARNATAQSRYNLLCGRSRVEYDGCGSGTAQRCLSERFLASRCTAPSKFAHMRSMSSAVRFLGRKCSTEDGNAAGTASRGHLWCCGTKTFLGCARSTLMTMPMSHCR